MSASVLSDPTVPHLEKLEFANSILTGGKTTLPKNSVLEWVISIVASPRMKLSDEEASKMWSCLSQFVLEGQLEHQIKIKANMIECCCQVLQNGGWNVGFVIHVLRDALIHHRVLVLQNLIKPVTLFRLLNSLIAQYSLFSDEALVLQALREIRLFLKTYCSPAQSVELILKNLSPTNTQSLSDSLQLSVEDLTNSCYFHQDNRLLFEMFFKNKFTTQTVPAPKVIIDVFNSLDSVLNADSDADVTTSKVESFVENLHATYKSNELTEMCCRYLLQLCKLESPKDDKATQHVSEGTRLRCAVCLLRCIRRLLPAVKPPDWLSAIAQLWISKIPVSCYWYEGVMQLLEVSRDDVINKLSYVIKESFKNISEPAAVELLSSLVDNYSERRQLMRLIKSFTKHNITLPPPVLRTIERRSVELAVTTHISLLEHLLDLFKSNTKNVLGLLVAVLPHLPVGASTFTSNNLDTCCNLLNKLLQLLPTAMTEHAEDVSIYQLLSAFASSHTHVNRVLRYRHLQSLAALGSLRATLANQPATGLSLVAQFELLDAELFDAIDSGADDDQLAPTAGNMCSLLSEPVKTTTGESVSWSGSLLELDSRSCESALHHLFFTRAELLAALVPEEFATAAERLVHASNHASNPAAFWSSMCDQREVSRVVIVVCQQIAALIDRSRERIPSGKRSKHRRVSKPDMTLSMLLESCSDLKVQQLATALATHLQTVTTLTQPQTVAHLIKLLLALPQNGLNKQAVIQQSVCLMVLTHTSRSDVTSTTDVSSLSAHALSRLFQNLSTGSVLLQLDPEFLTRVTTKIDDSQSEGSTQSEVSEELIGLFGYWVHMSVVKGVTEPVSQWVKQIGSSGDVQPYDYLLAQLAHSLHRVIQHCNLSTLERVCVLVVETRAVLSRLSLVVSTSSRGLLEWGRLLSALKSSCEKRNVSDEEWNREQYEAISNKLIKQMLEVLSSLDRRLSLEDFNLIHILRYWLSVTSHSWSTSLGSVLCQLEALLKPNTNVTGDVTIHVTMNAVNEAYSRLVALCNSEQLTAQLDRLRCASAESFLACDHARLEKLLEAISLIVDTSYEDERTYLPKHVIQQLTSHMLLFCSSAALSHLQFARSVAAALNVVYSFFRLAPCEETMRPVLQCLQLSLIITCQHSTNNKSDTKHKQASERGESATDVSEECVDDRERAWLELVCSQCVVLNSLAVQSESSHVSPPGHCLSTTAQQLSSCVERAKTLKGGNFYINRAQHLLNSYVTAKPFSDPLVNTYGPQNTRGHQKTLRPQHS